MPARTLPNLGLQAFFDIGEDGWDDEMSSNLLKLSVLTQGGVIDKVSADPVAPVDGDVYIFDETHPTNANAVAIRDAGAWVYVTPAEGWLLYNRAANGFTTFDGVTWGVLNTGGGGGIAEAPSDGEIYGRKDAAWAIVPQVSTSPITEKSGTATLMLAADAGAYLRFTGTSAKTFTVQPDATEALPDNSEWHLRNVGASTLTIVAGSGVTINPPAGGTLVVNEGGTVTLKRVATDEFDLFGQVVAA